MKAPLMPIRILLICVLMAFSVTRGLAATINWTNLNGGLWNVAENWIPQQVPGVADTVSITANGTYTVTVDVGFVIAGLTLGGSTGKQTLAVPSQSVSITGNSTISTNGTLQFAGGGLSSSGLLTLHGIMNWSAGKLQSSVSISKSGLLDMTTSADHEFVGSLANAGTVHWEAGTFYLEDLTTFDNLADGVFEAFGATHLQFIGTKPSQFNNQGTFRKPPGAGVTIVQNGFVNSGTVDVKGGSLQFPEGFISSGSFHVESAGRVELAGGVFSLNNGHSFTGDGFYGVTGDATLIGDITASNFQLVAGTMRGTNHLTGTLNWSTGFMRNVLTVAPTGILNIVSGNDHELAGTMTNAGTVHWSAGRFFLEDRTTFVNLAGATFDVQSDLQLNPAGTSPNEFINQGTFQKSGGLGQLSINLQFINSGTVQVQSGILHFNDGFVSSGNFNVAQAARLEMAAGTYNLNPGYSITGDGFYGITGDVTLIGDITASNFQLVAGTMRGTNHLTGTLNWSTGFMRNVLTVAPTGILNIVSGNDHELIGTMTNAGTVHWSAGRFYLEDQTTFVNLAGATFDVQSDLQLNPAGTSPNRFINEGTFRKSGGLGQLSIDLQFINPGTVQVQSGVLHFNEGFVSSGNFNVAQAARLELAAGTYSLNPGYSITGDGFYGITGDVTLIGDITPSNF